MEELESAAVWRAEPVSELLEHKMRERVSDGIRWPGTWAARRIYWLVMECHVSDA